MHKWLLPHERRCCTTRRRTGSGGLGSSSRPATPDDSLGGLPALALPVLRVRPEQLGAVDLLYLKNVLLKFLAALGAGRSSECQVLLPAVAALLHASPDEFAVLRASLGSGLGVGAWLGMG